MADRLTAYPRRPDGSSQMTTRFFLVQQPDGTFPTKQDAYPLGPDGRTVELEAVVFVDKDGNFLPVDAFAASSFVQELLPAADAAAFRAGIEVSSTAEMMTAISAGINAILDGAPANLDTLNELAAALADDANFASTVTTALSARPTSVALAMGDGAGLSGFIADYADAILTNLLARGRSHINVLDFIPTNLHAGILAETNVVDLSAYIQEAIDTGRNVEFPDGRYHASGLTMVTPYQKLVGRGKVDIYKNANTTLLTIGTAARGVHVDRINFEGSGATYTTSHNIEVNGPDVRFFGVESRGAGSNGGRALKSSGSSAGNLKWFGGICQTLDTGANGYDAEFDGVGNIYNALIGVNSSNSGNNGGILIKGDGTDVSLTDTQFGKLRTEFTTNAAGGRFKGCRFNGSATILSSFAIFDAVNFAGNVTIGNGVLALSGIVVGPTCQMIAGTTFTLNAGVQQSVFHLDMMDLAGITLSLNATAVAACDVIRTRAMVLKTTVTFGTVGTPLTIAQPAGYTIVPTSFAWRNNIAGVTGRYYLDVGRLVVREGDANDNGDIQAKRYLDTFGNAIVQARKTGWATATGAATRTTFDTASVTLPQLAERVKALIDDLHATAGHGLIGT